MPDRYGPYRNSRFLLEWGGIVQAGFSECTIPENTSEPIEYREGNEAPTVRKLWSLNQYANVTLQRGMTDNLELFEWRMQVENGQMDEARRDDVAIIVLNEEGGNGPRFEFQKAWPIRYDAPDLNATANEVAVEALELAHEKMERVQ